MHLRIPNTIYAAYSYSKSFVNKNCLLLIISLGSFLRFYKIQSLGLWYDEYYTLIKLLQYNYYLEIAKSSLLLRLSILAQKILYADPHPFIYYLLLYWLIWPFHFFAESYYQMLQLFPFIVRYPSAICSILSIFFLHRFVTQLYDRRIALISAFLLAINPLHIWYAQEARVYAINFFLITLFLFLFFRRAKAIRIWDHLLFLFVLLLVFFTNYISIFFVLCVVGGRFFLLKKEKIGAYAFFMSLLLILLIWGAFELSHISEGKLAWIEKPNFGFLWRQLAIFSLGYTSSDVLYYLTAVLITVLILLNGFIIDKQKKEYLFLVLILCLPVTIIYFLSHLMLPIFLTRYILYASIPCYVLTSVMLVRLKKTFFLGLLVLIALSMFSLYYYYTGTEAVNNNNHFFTVGVQPKKGYEKAFNYLLQNMEKSDRVAFVSRDVEHALYLYDSRWLYDKYKNRFYYLYEPQYLEETERMVYNVDDCDHPDGDVTVYGVMVQKKTGRRVYAMDEIMSNQIWVIYSNWQRKKTLTVSAQRVRKYLQRYYAVKDSQRVDDILLEKYALD